MPPAAQAEMAKLELALQAARQTLTSPLQPTPESAAPPPASALHATLLALLALLRSHTTSLALALGKQPPTPAAALPSLDKLQADWRRVEYVVRCGCAPTAGGGGAEGGALGREWSWARDEVREALVGLLDEFVSCLFPPSSAATSSAPPPPPPAAKDRYLQKVGAVYGVVDRATRSLSDTPLAAVRKRLEADGEALKDGESEAREMLDEDDGEDAASDEDDAEDESEPESEDDWAALLGQSGAKPTAVERELIASILPLLRLASSAHKHALSLLSSPTPPQQLSALPDLSAALLAAADELVAGLYAPIERAPLGSHADALAGAARALASASVGGLEEGAKARKWVALWEGQAERVLREVKEQLGAQEAGEEQVDGLAAKLGESSI